MTSTRMSLDIATTILRTVSAWALSPYLSLSSFVTPSTSIAISSPNSAAQVVECVVGVLDRVVQQRGGDGLRADAEVGEDLRDRDRVRDVRLAARRTCPAWARSAAMYARSMIAEIGLRMMRPHGLDQPVDRADGLRTGEKIRGTRRRRDAAEGVVASVIDSPRIPWETFHTSHPAP